MKWSSEVDDRPSIHSPRIRFSSAFANDYLGESGRKLDIGCGTGSFSFLIDTYYTVGIDLQIDALKVAKKYCPKSEFIIASVLNLPFKDETFHSIFMWEVMEYIERKRERSAIQEMYRILSYDSTLLLSAPNYHLIYNLMDPDYFLLHRQRHFKIEKLTALIMEAGFRIKDHTVRGGWKTIISMNFFYFCKHVLKKKGGIIQMFFDKRSEAELRSCVNGIANIFIIAQKIRS